MPDFTVTKDSRATFSTAFNELIDEAWRKKRAADVPRTYLGGSAVGDVCTRRIAYEWHKVPKDPGAEFTGRLYRIFERGHTAEPRMAGYIREAGFHLVTEKADGKQFGFAVAREKESGRPRIAGNIDGVLIDGPAKIGDVALPPYPGLWENKGINNKNYEKYLDKGVEKSNPVYFGQMQIYMAYMALDWALFTAENQDTCEVYAEVVKGNLASAQAMSDKAVAVVLSTAPEEFPRVRQDPDKFPCPWCAWKERCWTTKDARLATAPPNPWAK